ncbi:hypothetical protein FRB90_005750 [Tulasnella sp. 427]|nr:hypothetical protein FRB90_005750 [Tulasnella sp. 427]
MADTTKPTTETPKEAKTIESEIELAKRAFALRKFEESVEHYATALELFLDWDAQRRRPLPHVNVNSTEKHGDGAPESADLLFLYGKALLENAISQAGVVGKEETEGALKGNKEDEAGPSVSKTGKKVISFSGDAEADDEAVDLLGAAQNADEDDEDQEEGEGEGGDDEDEPEDDFNAAWEVLDLARALYAKADGDEAKLKLADTYMCLGDVSLETEKFDQAISDYSSGLSLKEKLLPLHSRQVAEAHYRLSLAMDLTPGRLSGAVGHAERALKSVDERLAILKSKLAEAPSDQDAAMEDGSGASAKGKAKATGMISTLANDTIEGLSKSQLESQIKEFEELRGDLAAKVEDLRSAPEQPIGESGQVASVTEAANRALDEALNPGYSLAGPSGAVNDLSGMIKKKKKAPAAESAQSSSAPGTGASTPGTLDISGKSSGKRKAEDEEMADGATTPVEKRVKLTEDAETGTNSGA